jgi:hypothetical protein
MEATFFTPDMAGDMEYPQITFYASTGGAKLNQAVKQLGIKENTKVSIFKTEDGNYYIAVGREKDSYTVRHKNSKSTTLIISSKVLGKLFLRDLGVVDNIIHCTISTEIEDLEITVKGKTEKVKAYRIQTPNLVPATEEDIKAWNEQQNTQE